VTVAQQPGANILLELRAREAFMRRRYDEALTYAREAAELAIQRGDSAAWWQMMFLQGECFREQGLYKECRAIAEELRLHPLTAVSPALAAKVLTLLSVASQIMGVGTLSKAIELAREALRLSDLDTPASGLKIEALQALIAALAENQQLDEAWAECLILARVLDSEPDSQVAGKAYWAIGNVAFLRQRTADGVKYHRLAAEHLSPTNDLALWAWFNRASAAMRLAAEVADEGTYECIQRAELATSIVGGNDGDRLIVDFIKGHWLLLTGDPESAIAILREVSTQSPRLANHITGDSLLLLGRALCSNGDPGGGLDYLRQSEEHFRQAGSVDRAAQAAALISEMQASH
jgi:tetratricopeptide (TPR) repeat protein